MKYFIFPSYYFEFDFIFNVDKPEVDIIIYFSHAQGLRDLSSQTRTELQLLQWIQRVPTTGSYWESSAYLNKRFSSSGYVKL